MNCTELSKLSKLSKLSQLSKLSELSKLSQLSKLSELPKLSKRGFYYAEAECEEIAIQRSPRRRNGPGDHSQVERKDRSNP